jgi:hypothetical protein
VRRSRTPCPLCRGELTHMMLMPARFLSICICLVASATACNAIIESPNPAPPSAPPRDASPLQTDSVSYRLVRTPHEYSAVVRGTFRNATAAPIYFKRCMPRDSTPMFRLARTGPDSSRRFFVDWGWACVGGVPTGVLLPGQSVTIHARVGSVDQPSKQPPLQPYELVGLLRIRLSLCARFLDDSDYCEGLAESHGQSNAFLVHY